MSNKNSDKRAIGVGGLVGAIPFAASLILSGSLLTSHGYTIGVMLVAGSASGIVAGVVAGQQSTIGVEPMNEGGTAAFLGLLIGLVLWTGVRIVASPLHPADTVLYLILHTFAPLLIAFPIAIILGAVAGERVLLSDVGTRSGA
jgi:hypothetical protein